MAEKKISEFEDKSIKIFQAIMQIEKIKTKQNKTKQNISRSVGQLQSV